LRVLLATGLAPLTAACGSRTGLFIGEPIDEEELEIPCEEGQTRECGSKVGACRPGERHCVAGTFGSCEGSVTPTDEACNGIDDDCDGSTDEDFHLGEACDGPDSDLCDDDERTCDGCTHGPDALETCNGVDDDCDGVVDDGSDLCGSPALECSNGRCVDPCVAQGGCPIDAAPSPECVTNADCRLFSDYCTGCDCRALARGQADPECPGPGVSCLRDPCEGEAAECRQGLCIVAGATSTPCGTESCAPGQVCVRKEIGPGYTYACAANPCIGRLDCSCADSLCGGSPHVCGGAEGNVLTCPCPVCA
jgi:hypothetical protein